MSYFKLKKKGIGGILKVAFVSYLVERTENGVRLSE